MPARKINIDQVPDAVISQIATTNSNANSAIAIANTANLQGVRLGAYNASTNTPTLTTDASAVTAGAFYDVTVAGTSSITGTSTVFGVGDRLAKSGSIWYRIPTLDYAKISNWQVQNYAIGSQVNYLGIDYVANIACVSTDVPGVSINWIERLAYTKKFVLSADFSSMIVNGVFGYVDKASGTFKSDQNFRRTDYISVRQGDTISYKLIGHTVISSIAIYNDAKVFLSSGVSGAVNSTAITGSYVVPAGVTYVIISGERLASNLIFVIGIDYNSASINQVFTNNLTSIIKNATDIVDLKKYAQENLIETQVNLSGYIGTSGQILSATDANWKRTDYITSFEGRQYRLAMIGHTAINSISFYDSANNYISGVKSLVDAGLVEAIATAPANTAFLKLSWGAIGISSTISTCMFLSSLAEKVKFLLATSTAPTVLSFDSVYPKKIYSVANNIDTSLKGFTRSYSACVYLDHFFNGITQEYDLQIAETSRDSMRFISPINVTGPDETNPAIAYNDDNSTVKKYTKNLTIKGPVITTVQKTVQHVSTLATSGQSLNPRILCIGDSITYGERATFPSETQIQNYPLLTKQLFEMDRLDNAGTGFGCTLLGTQKRSLDYTYKGSNTINACHEGRRGWTIDQYIATGSPFWNATTSKFSVKTWLDQYRTLDDTGVRLASNSSAKGSLVTDVTAFDVCLPSHIVIMLGANGGDTATDFIAKLNALIATIKAEYTANAWGIINISFALFDSAGTYFPSKHPKFDASIAFWNDLNGSQPTRHERMFLLNREYINTNLATDNEDTNRVFYLPAYFTMPTAESAVIRQVPTPTTKNFFGNQDTNTKYGWYPTVHLNPDAHFSFAYQLYSWVKYTFTL